MTEIPATVLDFDEHEVRCSLQMEKGNITVAFRRSNFHSPVDLSYGLPVALTIVENRLDVSLRELDPRKVQEGLNEIDALIADIVSDG